jgi:type IV pilus assembly protein PilM
MTANRVITIEISDYGTRLCELIYKMKHPYIHQSVEFKNPVQSVEDGFILDRVSYMEMLREQLSKARIRSKDVVFTLASNKVLNREIVIPEMKEKLIGEYIENERDNFFPMDTTNHVLTYHIVEAKKEEKQLRIMVFAAPSVLINNYINLASEMDFKIVSIDYNGNSIYQWLRTNKNQKIDLYLQMNERNTMFTILENGALALQRNMNFGTDSLIQNLINSGYYGKLDEVAATVALTQEDNFFSSFAATEEVSQQDEKQVREYELKLRMTELFRPLVGNIARVLEYYNMKNKEAKLRTIYVGGTGVKINGLKKLLENEFNGMEFEMLVNLPDLNVAKTNHLCNVKSSVFTACIGAAQPSINFMKVDEKEELKKSVIFSLVSLVVITLISVVIVLNGISEYHDALKTRETLNTKITEISSIEELEKVYQDEMLNLEEVTAMDNSVYRYNEEWTHIMDYLESELPSDTIISSLSSSNSGLTMNITMNSKEEAAKLLLQLQKIPYFTSVSINGLIETTDPETDIKTVSFSVACAYYEEQTVPEETQETIEDEVKPE